MTWDKGRFLETASKTGQTISYKYDFNGIRTEKTVNGTKTEYFYVGSVLMSQKTGSEETDFSYDASGRPYALKYNGTVYYYLLNLQGDVIGIYDSNGNIVVSYKYDAWGKLLEITGSLSDTVGEKNPLRYRGYYYDTETNLYYLQSRYYDPETCRFISADSLLVAGDAISGTNMFAYCLNNPVMYEDPSGEEANETLADLLAIYISACIIADVLDEEMGIVFAEGLVYGGASPREILHWSLILAVDPNYFSSIKSIPDHPDYKPSKGGGEWVKNPNGYGYGWKAKDGGVWVWTKGMHGGDGWTVQYPNGNHTHKYPGGGSREHQIVREYVLVGLGVFATAIILADDFSTFGIVDDVLVPVLWTTIS